MIVHFSVLSDMIENSTKHLVSLRWFLARSYLLSVKTECLHADKY